MSTLSLLVDCHRITGTITDIKDGSKIARSFGKIGSTILKQPRRRSRHSSGTNSGVIVDLKCTTICMNTSNVLIIIVRLQFQRCEHDSLTDVAKRHGLKNLLFGYSDPHTKEWAALQKYMQKNNLNLLSVAKFIEQALKFDL